MPDFETLYPARFLKGRSLERPTTIRIVAMITEELEGEKGKKQKAILKYQTADASGEAVWCKTNSALTSAALNDARDYDTWAGRFITIAFDPNVKMGSETPGGIRVIGSPELKKPRKVEIKRPRRAQPDVYTLAPTDMDGRVLRAPATAPAAKPEPGSAG
jgi:hypothetical protein